MAPSAARYPRLLIRLLPIHRFESCDTTLPSLRVTCILVLASMYIYIYICSSSRHSSNSHVGFAHACELKRVPKLRLRRHGGRGGGGERGKGVGARSNEAATAQLTPNLESRSFLRRGYIVNDSVVSHVFFPPLVLSSRDKTRRASLEGGSRAIVISPTVPPQRDCCRLSSLSLSLSLSPS